MSARWSGARAAAPELIASLKQATQVTSEDPRILDRWGDS